MIGMQYKIKLDYDMNIIRERVQKNGFKTDGLKGLLMKAYLIMDSPQGKEYSPLYIWKTNEGMNEFIFHGFYDNILGSFGWQQIHISVPYHIELADDFHKSKYVMERKYQMKESKKMQPIPLKRPLESSLGYIVLYNPELWEYTEYDFYSELPQSDNQDFFIYEILHISR